MSDLQAHRLDVTETEYHADPCEAPSLSNSLAKVLLFKSPLHAWHTHPRLGKGEREEKKVFDLGQLAHKLVLGKGREIEIIEAKDYRTKLAQDARDAAYAAGKIPALRESYDNAVTAATVIAARLGKMGVVLDGQSEFQLAWQERSNRGPIWCRGMLDHVTFHGRGATIYDFKTTRSAHPSACARACLTYGYDVQQAAYTSALGKLMPDLVGRIDFVFLFGEMTAPYAVLPARLDDVLREHGEDGWNRAVIGFGDHSAEVGEWPGYANEIVTLEAPGWLLNEVEIGFEEGGA